MQSNYMSERMETHFGPGAKSMSIRQTRRGWFQEILGCEAPDEFKWFNTSDRKNVHFATSLENSDCCMRMCCSGCHDFSMDVKEKGSRTTILTLHRPMACNVGPCKCCCYNEMSISAGGRRLGMIKEQFFVCVPRMVITDGRDVEIYKVHQPTCCGGVCVDICAEGNPCFGEGCCKEPFHIFPADQITTDDGAPFVGKILKLPKSLAVELFTDAEAYDVTFPKNSTTEQKALIAASSVYINANFFESETTNQ